MFMPFSEFLEALLEVFTYQTAPKRGKREKNIAFHKSVKTEKIPTLNVTVRFCKKP